MKTSIPLCGLIVVGCLLGGCSPGWSFDPETFQIADNEVDLKAWAEGRELSVEIRLDPADEQITLHSIALVSPGGRRLQPTTWKDETFRASDIKIPIGIGIGFPIVRGLGAGIGTGVRIPLGPKGKYRQVRDVDAFWALSDPARVVAEYSLEVNLATIYADKTDIETLLLKMSHPTPAEPGKPKKAREVNFTRRPGGG